jgi:hypothetical protein
MVKNQYSKYAKEIASSKHRTKFQHKLESMPFLPPRIHNVLTPPAIKRIRQQDLLHQKEQRQRRGGHPCSGLSKKTNGLSCRHTLQEEMAARSTAPVLLLSPGYRSSRLLYNAVASAIDSEGFVVITMDRPEETNIITYLDGHSVYSNALNPVDLDVVAPYAPPRAADASFIIDQLSNTTAMDELCSGEKPSKFSTDRVGIIGHSLGGAVAVLAAGLDPRIGRVINLDGPFFGSLPPTGLSRPVLYVASEIDEFPLWRKIWPELRGPTLWMKVANVSHEGMTDFPTMIQAAGPGTGIPADLFGTTAPIECIRILTAYTTEWMNGAFAGKVGGPLLLGHESDRFPEVSTILKENF